MDSIASPLIAIVGPTGSGKSHLALMLAKQLCGEVVNCDSVQVYRGLDIGSAKLNGPERQGIPHHLIDVIEVGGRELTAGTYARLARPVLAEISARGAIPIVTGGTGFYLRALLDGLSPAPSRHPGLRRRLAALGARRPAALHRYLKYRDPVAAQRIHPRDLQKLIRAIELTLVAGRPVSELQDRPRQALHGFTTLKIGLDPDRESLYSYLNARAEKMFRTGLVQETRALLENGVPHDAKAFESLGYRQAMKILKQNLPVDDAIRECQTKTRQYAKRQLTWFRPEPNVHWLAGFGTEPEIQQVALSLARTFLEKFRDSEPERGLV